MPSHRRSWFVSLVFVLCVGLDAAPVRAETLVIAGDAWCPVNCAADAEQRGIFVELAEQIFAEAGIAVEYRVTNWARAVHETRAGKLNALIGAGVHDAPDFLFGEVPVGLSRTCFYARQGSLWRYRDVRSLADVSVGVINGYSYGEDLDSYIRRHREDSQRIQMASGDRALAINVEKVQLGRIEAALENTWVMDAYLARSGIAGALEAVGCRVPDVPIYLAFSPVLASSARHLAIFEAGVQRYRQDGRLQALLRRYGVSDPR